MVIKMRPHLPTSLSKLAEDFELILYSSEPISKVEKMMKTLPENVRSLFSHILGLEHCIVGEQADESICFRNLDYLTFNRELKDIIIVAEDLKPMGLYLGNTIPIRPFKGEKYDDCLYYLREYLQNTIL